MALRAIGRGTFYVAATASVFVYAAAGYNYVTGKIDQVELQKEKRWIQSQHKDYSSCMRKIHIWHNKYKEEAGQELKKQLQSFESTSANAEEVETCRSLCKDYWYAQFRFMKKYAAYNESELNELRARHRRFASVVPQLDVMRSYSDKEKRVYKFPDNIETKY